MDQINIDTVTHTQPPEEITASGDRELQAKSVPNLVAKYKLFQSATGAKTDVVYHPASAVDMSPSVAFPDSRVIYVETNEKAVDALKQAGLEAHHASAREFDPGPVDILILLNPTISPEFPSRFVVPGGYVVGNDYHGSATHMLGEKDFDFRGVVVAQKDGTLSYDTEDLDDYLKPVETDEEWQAAPLTWGGENYGTAANVVEMITGKRENVLEEYKKLLEEAQEKDRQINEELHRDHPEMAQLLARMQDFFMVTHESKTFVLSSILPRKKGTVDDLFVFQRKGEVVGENNSKTTNEPEAAEPADDLSNRRKRLQRLSTTVDPEELVMNDIGSKSFLGADEFNELLETARVKRAHHKRGTYMPREDGNVYIYAKRDFICPDLESAKVKLLFCEEMTRRGALFPGTKWSIFQRPSGQFHVFAVRVSSS